VDGAKALNDDLNDRQFEMFRRLFYDVGHNGSDSTEASPAGEQCFYSGQFDAKAV
jgi:hypothetical protein